MDNYARVEKELRNYNVNKVYLDNIESQIEQLKENDGAKGLSYDGISTSPTNVTSDSTANVAIRNMQEVDRLSAILLEGRRMQKSIDSIRHELSDIENTIIDMFYIGVGNQWYQIAYEVGYSERHCKRIRTDAVNKLVAGIYGRGECIYDSI